MHLILNRLLLYIALLMPAFSAFSQDEDLYDHSLDESRWNELRDAIRYENQPDGPGREWTYENQNEYRKARKKYGDGGSGGGNGHGGSNDGGSYRPENYEAQPQSSPSYNPSISPSVFNGLGALGYVLVVIFILLLAFLIFYLFVNREKDGKKITKLDLDEVAPTEIPLTELERMLRDALARNDFRAAVRIYFIFILRDLSNKSWIRWEKEKTNFQYLREMNGRPEYDAFNTSVGYFEIIWYGKREIDRQTFDKIQPDFTKLLDHLGVK